jgi:hypothetical protein
MKTHQQLRHRGLLSLQEIQEQEGNLSAAEIIVKNIRKELHDHDLAIIHAIKNPQGRPPISKHEQYLLQWRQINPVFHPAQRLSLNTIEVPHTDRNNNLTDDPDKAATWTPISDPLLIEEKLLAQNIAHFGQAQGTLFTTQHLQQLFGYSRVNNTGEQLLNGEQAFHKDIPLSPGGTLLLNLLSKKGRGLPPINSSISLKDFSSAFRKWSERTSIP